MMTGSNLMNISS